MSIKGLGLMMALAGMSAMYGPGMTMPAPKRRYNLIPGKLIHSGVPDNHIPAKGSKMEKVYITVKVSNYLEVGMHVNICYSTPKTRAKSIHKIEQEILSYASQVPLKTLIERNEMGIMFIERPLKGHWNGDCNRTACNKSPASYYNHSTQKYYCKECALMINEHNRADAHRLYGHDLCLHVNKPV